MGLGQVLTGRSTCDYELGKARTAIHRSLKITVEAPTTMSTATTTNRIVITIIVY